MDPARFGRILVGSRSGSSQRSWVRVRPYPDFMTGCVRIRVFPYSDSAPSVSGSMSGPHPDPGPDMGSVRILGPDRIRSESGSGPNTDPGLIRIRVRIRKNPIQFVPVEF